MVLGDHTEYLTHHPFHCGWSEVWIIGTDGSQGYIFLRWFQAHHVFMDEAHHFLPDLLRCKGEGVARCVLPCISFLSFGGTWAGLSAGYQIIPGGTVPHSTLHPGWLARALRGHWTSRSAIPSDARGHDPSSTGPLLLLECTGVLHRSWRDQQPLQMRAVLELLELGYLPMVVALGPDPSCEQAKSFQVAACAVHEALVHIAHVTEWLQFFDVQPLALSFFHHLNELVPVAVPLTDVQGADLGGIKASDYVHEIPLPPGGHKVHEVLHRILAGDIPSPLRSLGGGPILPCSGMRGLFLATSLLPGLWSSPLSHTLTLASCSFSLGYGRGKPHLLRWVYCLLVWGGWMCLLTSWGSSWLMGGWVSWLAQAYGARHSWSGRARRRLMPKSPAYPSMSQWVVARRHVHRCRRSNSGKDWWRPCCWWYTSHGGASGGHRGWCHWGITGLGWDP